METTGPRWACRIVEAMAGIMDTTSTSVFTVEERAGLRGVGDGLLRRAALGARAPETIQNGGQSAIQKQVEGGVGTMAAC